MAATDTGTRNLLSADDIDDSLFNYDVDDVFRDVDTNMAVPALQKPAARAEGNENGAGLGIDEEIKVTKKRVPVAKLDQNRLLSPTGIPKLRRIARERLQFKGKGHEYSDVARLLNAYQLWLDDLYPRAKFADGLAIIEKLGHTKRMQTMRREWINEGKPQESLGNLGKGAEKAAAQQSSGEDRPWEVKSGQGPRTLIALAGNDDDLYVATPQCSRADGMAEGDGDKEKICSEDFNSIYSAIGQKCGSPAKEVEFDDDEEALLALNDTW